MTIVEEVPLRQIKMVTLFGLLTHESEEVLKH